MARRRVELMKSSVLTMVETMGEAKPSSATPRRTKLQQSIGQNQMKPRGAEEGSSSGDGDGQAAAVDTILVLARPFLY